MNLFVTDICPRESAWALDDKRVGKLLMEANQMLSLAVKIHDDNLDWLEHVGPGKISSGWAHKNHPVPIWVRETRANFRWTVQHAYALAAEWLIVSALRMAQRSGHLISQSLSIAFHSAISHHSRTLLAMPASA